MARLMATGIDRIPSGRYRARVLVNGERRTKSFALRRDAVKWRAQQIAAGERAALGERQPAPTLGVIAAEHMTAVRPNLADVTYRVYRRMWAAHMDPSVGGRSGTAHALISTPVDKITPKDVETLRTDLLARTGPAAARKVMILVGAMLDRAVRDGHIDRNPAAGIKRPSGKRVRVVWPVTPTEVERIAVRLTGADALMVRLLAYSGMRPGEARVLTFDEIGQRSIALHASKTNRPRSVRLLAPLRDDLEAWKVATGRSTGPIFARADGKPWSEHDFNHWRDRRFSAAVKAAGVKLGRPYDLRHSAASLWLREGHNAVQVAAWLGHSLAELSRTYAHVIGDLDPDERINAEALIYAARDQSVTSDADQPSPAEATV